MRFVSLCPSLTELLFDLGVGTQVVGRTRFCVHPADGVRHVVSVGGTKNPKVDRIVELAPDVVFMNEEENRREDAESLRALGIRVEASLPVTLDDTAQMIRSIALTVGADARGEELAGLLEREAASVSQRAAARRPVRYAYLIWRDPWMSISSATFVASMLEVAGGVNVFGAATDRYPVVTTEALRAASLDVVLLASEPFPFGEKHRLELSAATGLGVERMLLADGELLSWHGSRAIAGVQYAERLLQAVPSADQASVPRN